jgi:hypothetical protein
MSHEAGEKIMKTRTALLSLTLLVAGATAGFAQSPLMGTWKLNEAKSKIPVGFPKNTSVVYVAAGDSVKISTDGLERDGKPTHTEWTGKFDGKDYPVVGDPTLDTRSYMTVDDHTLTMINKKGGKVMTNGEIEVARDGKTRKVILHGTDADGKKATGVALYDKQ